MNQLHITLEENSPAIKWTNTQADRIGARGHVGTHLDCYTTVPEKPEYNITAMVLDCQNEFLFFYSEGFISFIITCFHFFII